jgi:hypothetical protein
MSDYFVDWTFPQLLYTPQRLFDVHTMSVKSLTAAQLQRRTLRSDGPDGDMGKMIQESNPQVSLARYNSL